MGECYCRGPDPNPTHTPPPFLILTLTTNPHPHLKAKQYELWTLDSTIVDTSLEDYSNEVSRRTQERGVVASILTAFTCSRAPHSNKQTYIPAGSAERSIPCSPDHNPNPNPDPNPDPDLNSNPNPNPNPTPITSLSDSGAVNASLDKLGKIDPATSTALIGIFLGNTFGFMMDTMIASDEGLREYLWSPQASEP